MASRRSKKSGRVVEWNQRVRQRPRGSGGQRARENLVEMVREKAACSG